MNETAEINDMTDNQMTLIVDDNNKLDLDNLQTSMNEIFDISHDLFNIVNKQSEQLILISDHIINTNSTVQLANVELSKALEYSNFYANTMCTLVIVGLAAVNIPVAIYCGVKFGAISAVSTGVLSIIAYKSK
ncbi:MAG: hypothetical protein Faunusvirus7_23 [Faunusvirus sp.]|jgi:t-SNARE complex subunit (syntaxin)|uniref:t-SNARE coiled-coil homology domain-containing protein n=1 Tax=Faunusvirus sp. TaxID=2487766 RepID=A0A3G4ZWL4_9VIRU|nr:MAG: hypothetical protein Faunusvirus7_23 [Faunusvirus sp.]